MSGVHTHVNACTSMSNCHTWLAFGFPECAVVLGLCAAPFLSTGLLTNAVYAVAPLLGRSCFSPLTFPSYSGPCVYLPPVSVCNTCELTKSYQHLINTNSRAETNSLFLQTFQDIDSCAISGALQLERCRKLGQALESVFFFWIFQLLDVVASKAQCLHGFPSRMMNYRSLSWAPGLRKRCKYKVCLPIVLIIPFIPTPPLLASPLSLLFYLASLNPVLVVAEVVGYSLWLCISSSTWSERDGFGLMTEIIGSGPDYFRWFRQTMMMTASSLSTVACCIISLNHLSFLTLHKPRWSRKWRRICW